MFAQQMYPLSCHCLCVWPKQPQDSGEGRGRGLDTLARYGKALEGNVAGWRGLLQA